MAAAVTAVMGYVLAGTQRPGTVMGSVAPTVAAAPAAGGEHAAHGMTAI